MDQLLCSTPRRLVPPAEAVNLTLRNDGTIQHDLTVPSLGIHIVARPGRSVTAGLKDLERGRHDGFCSVRGHEDGGMHLKVIVE